MSDCQEFEGKEEGVNKWSFQGSKIILDHTVIVEARYTFAETHKMIQPKESFLVYTNI